MSAKDQRPQGQAPQGEEGNARRKGPERQQQQDAGSGSRQQSQGGEGKQYGEGNYAATKQYNEGMKEHVENHDIEREARDAAPRSEAEAREMEQAERVGRSKSRGEGASPDGEPEK